MPPIANASHIALPAACATTPRIEKMPAPTMPPMPIDTAAAMPICPGPLAVLMAIPQCAKPRKVGATSCVALLRRRPAALDLHGLDHLGHHAAERDAQTQMVGL